MNNDEGFGDFEELPNSRPVTSENKRAENDFSDNFSEDSDHQTPKDPPITQTPVDQKGENIDPPDEKQVKEDKDQKNPEDLEKEEGNQKAEVEQVRKKEEHETPDIKKGEEKPKDEELTKQEEKPKNEVEIKEEEENRTDVDRSGGSADEKDLGIGKKFNMGQVVGSAIPKKEDKQETAPVTSENENPRNEEAQKEGETNEADVDETKESGEAGMESKDDDMTAQDKAQAMLKEMEDSQQSEDEDVIKQTFTTQQRPKNKFYNPFPTKKEPEVIYRKHKGVSIETYDPNEYNPFTDSLTIDAIKNLGLSEEDLFYPTDKDIASYTRDKSIGQTVRKQLVERVDRIRKTVKDECDRIARIPPPKAILSKGSPKKEEEKVSYAAQGQKSFEELENERIERLRRKNKREAEQIIITIVTEKILQEEDEVARQIEIEESRKKEEELRKKHRDERNRLAENVKKQEEMERQRSKTHEQILKKLKEEEERNVQIQIEREEKIHQNFLILEEERKRKLEAARIAAENAEIAKKIKFENQRKIISEKEQQFKERKIKEAQEREKENKEKAIQSRKRLEQLRLQQIKLIEDKKKKSDLNEANTMVSLQKKKEEKEKYIQTLKLREEEKHTKAMSFIYVKEKEEAEKKRKILEENEMLSTQRIAERKKEKKHKIEEESLVNQIKCEERKLAAYMLKSKHEASAKEKAIQYEMYIKKLEQDEEEKRLELERKEKIRNELEKKKRDALSGDAQMKAELRKKNSHQLEKIANQWDIDINSIKQQIEKKRHKKVRVASKNSDDSNQSKLPPISGKPKASTTNSGEGSNGTSSQRLVTHGT